MEGEDDDDAEGNGVAGKDEAAAVGVGSGTPGEGPQASWPGVSDPTKEGGTSTTPTWGNLAAPPVGMAVPKLRLPSRDELATAHR